MIHCTSTKAGKRSGVRFTIERGPSLSALTGRFLGIPDPVITTNRVVCGGKVPYNSLAANARRGNNAGAAFSAKGE